MGEIIAATAILTGAGTKAYATMQQARAQAAQLDDQADETALDALALRQATGREVARLARRNRRERGDAHAQVAASGFRADVGSPLDALAEHAFELEMDLVNTQIAGRQAARKLDMQQSRLRDASKSVIRQARVRAASELLGGGVQAGSLFA